MSSAAARLLAGTEGGRRLDLDAHVAVHGPLHLALDKRGSADPAPLIAELEVSGLTGRGGGGFPTAAKLAAATARGGRRRTALVVNLMEGEPSSSKDAVLGSYAPHLVLDGAAVLAAVLGGASVTVAVARGNEGVRRSIEQALVERRAVGMGPEVEIAEPPDRYVAGEESALSAWLDGADARPTFRPDKPATLSIGRRVSYVENAETTAAIALIARSGGRAFAAGGAGGVGGTALCTISGAVESPGVREVPVGTPLGEVIAQAGALGTITGVLLGGFGGSFVGPDALGAPWSIDGLRPLGASPGAGVVHVVGADSCGLVEIARIARWMAAESAGQCGPCVFGLPALADDLELVARRRSKGRLDLRLNGHLSLVEGRGACAHPDGVARMVRSGLAVYSRELAEHLAGRACSAAGGPVRLELPTQSEVIEWR